jgi:hypothetical protein
MVNVVARTLAAHPAAIRVCNGREVGLALVRDWLRSIGQSSIFGRWQVKVVNELDRCSRDTQDLLLTYLSSERNLLFAGGVAGGTGNGGIGGLISSKTPDDQSCGSVGGNFGIGRACSLPLRKSMEPPHFSSAKTPAANTNSIPKEPKKPMRMRVLCTASAMAKLQPIRTISPEIRLNPGTSSNETRFRISTSVPIIVAIGRK